MNINCVMTRLQLMLDSDSIQIYIIYNVMTSDSFNTEDADLTDMAEVVVCGAYRHFQQYFSYIVAVSFIGKTTDLCCLIS